MKNNNDTKLNHSGAMTGEPPVVEVDKVCRRAAREHRIRMAVSIVAVALCLASQLAGFSRSIIISAPGVERSAVVITIDEIMHSL